VTATEDRRREYVGEEMTLVEHLRELRERLLKSFLAIAVGFVGGFIFRNQVLDLLMGPYCGLPAAVRDFPGGANADADRCELVITTVTGGFTFSIKAAAVVAVIVAAPVVAYQVLRFVTPGLRPIEKQYSIPFVIATAVLFLCGAAVSYYVLPQALRFLLSFTPDLVPLLDANSYLSFVLNTMLAFGISFEFPLVLIVLSFASLVTVRGLRDARRYFIFGAFVIAAIVTPGQDPFTLVALGGILTVFFEIAVLVAWLIERNRARAAASAGTVGA
jgi:sec-independent protein translocase protein TatC